MTIEEELHIDKFQDVYQKAHVNLFFTAGILKSFFNRILKDNGLTYEQYTVLRILSKNHPDTLSVREITDRMTDRSSNTTRIIDRLVIKKFVERRASHKDGRVAKIALNKESLNLIGMLGKEVLNLSLHSGFTPAEAENLSALLDKMRESLEKSFS